MRTVVFLCLLLLSTGADAQVRVESDVVLGLPQDVVVEYGGMTAGGLCFVLTRPAGDDWDTTTYARVYDGTCSGPLTDWGGPMVMKFRDGRISFSYNLHPTPRGKDFDVILISSNPSTPSKYKMTPFVFKKFKRAEP